MRAGIWLRLSVGMALGAAAALTAWASWDGSEPPTWELAKPTYDPHGSAAMLLPGNDTRVNLYLLLADRRGAPMLDARAKQEGLPLVLFPWDVLSARTVPASTDEGHDGCPSGQAGGADCPASDTSNSASNCRNSDDGSVTCSADASNEADDTVWNFMSRCQTNGSGAADFIAAVRANRRVPDNEKAVLIGARNGLRVTAEPVKQYGDQECRTTSILPDALSRIGSRPGRAFGTYLQATGAFYDGQFDQAVEQFRTLADASDPWVREASAYMVGRSRLNQAFGRSVSEYGSLADANKRDRSTAQAAADGFEAYLKAYPDGRYASSARGLLRRAHWIGGDEDALAADFGRQITAAKLDGAADDVALVDEIDNKLPLPTNKPAAIRDPVLLAVVDLHRMRQTEGYPSMHVSRTYTLAAEEYPGEQITRADCCGPAITKEEIEGQRALFGRDVELFDYIRAAEAYFVRHQPQDVLKLIPDAARQQRFSYLQFSRQMLRGLALRDTGDRNARAFWLSLFSGAVQPYQRGALELALAMHDEKTGQLRLIFDPDSRVSHPIIRELLLERTAGPEILRQQATQPGVPKIEREIALYILLSKELRRGFYREFLSDMRLLPADAPTDTYFSGALGYDAKYDSEQVRPPLERFGPSAKLGRAGCPSLKATASQLANRPHAARPRLCLAEFFRQNGFDDFNAENSFDEPVAGNGLASSRSLFPAGTPYARLEVYKQIMNDPAAGPDDKAWALNRAVRCYAPGGNNSCGGTEVALSERRAWFNRLRSQYPQSRWARELEYYW